MLRNICQAVAEAKILVSRPVWNLSRIILALAAIGTLYGAYSLTPYSLTNLLLLAMGTYVLVDAFPKGE